MKKIVSLLLATIMMVSFSAVSFALEPLTIAGSNATVEQNATGDDAKVDVTFTFTFPAEVGLLAFAPDITFNRSALTLNNFELSGFEWSTTKSNTGAAHGAYCWFEDAQMNGSTPATQYVMTLNFTVNDPSVATTYDIGIQNLSGTDTNWMGLDESYTWDLSNVKSTITVESDQPVVETKTVGFATTVDYVAGKTGVKFAITTDDDAATVKTKEVPVAFGTIIESKTTGIKMGVNVNNVPETVGLSATAELY